MNKIVLHVCNNVKKEVEKSLESIDSSNIEIRNFTSYCGQPPVKMDNLEKFQEIDKEQIHLAVGSICLKELKEQKAGFSDIVTEDNCFYLFLNKELVDYYILDGAYLITPGWLINWKKYIDIWKFDRKMAREFFSESCKYLLFLDTGIYEDIDSYLKEFSNFIQKEARTLPIGLEYFKMKLLSTISEQRNKIALQEEEQENRVIKRKSAEYAMAMDLIGDLSKSRNENEVVENILKTMNMLFAPKSLHYLIFKENIPDKLVTYTGQNQVEEAILKELSNLKNQYEWTESGNGFCLSIRFNDETLGALYISELTYPQYKEDYLNLGLYLTKICGLAISNARSFQIVQTQKEQLIISYGDVKESEQKFRLLFSNMINGFALHEIVTDKKGTPIDYIFLDINSAFERLTGLQRDDILMKTATTVLPGIENDPSDWITKYGRVAQLDEETRFEQYSEVLDKWFSVLAFCPQKGQFATIFEDITARKKAEEKIIKTQEHIEVLNRILWHDITNSFSVLHSGIRIFKQTSDMKILDDANSHIQKSVDLIKKMRQLSYTLSESAQLESIDVQPVVKKLIHNFNFNIKMQGSCNVMADDALNSVIDNLVSNAIKHSETTELLIKMSEEGEKAIIEICDNGIGISDEFKEKVFEESFFMGKTGNSGLGLFIVKKTIERYGGSISIIDNKPQGSIFRIELKKGDHDEIQE